MKPSTVSDEYLKTISYLVTLTPAEVRDLRNPYYSFRGFAEGIKIACIIGGCWIAWGIVIIWIWRG